MSLGLQFLIAFVAGGLLGLLMGWLLSRGHTTTPPSDLRLEQELRGQLDQGKTQLAQLRDQLTENMTARASAEAKHAAAEEMLVRQHQMQTQTLADLKVAFKALSADALSENAPKFLLLANAGFEKFQETAKGDLAQRQEAIKGLVDPLKVQLETYQTRLQASDTAQSGALGEVKKALETLTQGSQALAAETEQFRMVLRSNQPRG